TSPSAEAAAGLVEAEPDPLVPMRGKATKSFACPATITRRINTRAPRIKSRVRAEEKKCCMAPPAAATSAAGVRALIPVRIVVDVRADLVPVFETVLSEDVVEPCS